MIKLIIKGKEGLWRMYQNYYDKNIVLENIIFDTNDKIISLEFKIKRKKVKNDFISRKI